MQDETEEQEIYNDDLIIPIYIDTNALLDLLASVEKGFSIVERVTTHNTQSNNSDQSLGGGTEFGIPKILNLFKIKLDSSANWKQGKVKDEERAAERYHTYGSLLQRLRVTLVEHDLVREFDGTTESWNSIEPHDFVEIRGKFRLNPSTEALDTIERLLAFFEIFAQFQNPSSPHHKTNKPKAQGNTQVNPPNPFAQAQQISLGQVKQIRTFIRGMLDQLEKKDIRITVIGLNNSPKHKAVAYLFTEYLRDPSMTELQYKEYKLSGKVVGKLSAADEAVDLLQGTAFSGFNETTLANLIEAFDQLGNSGMNLPKIEMKISAPVLQIIPIAIYV